MFYTVSALHTYDIINWVNDSRFCKLTSFLESNLIILLIFFTNPLLYQQVCLVQALFKFYFKANLIQGEVKIKTQVNGFQNEPDQIDD